MLVFDPMPAVRRLAGKCARIVNDEVGLAEFRQLLLRGPYQHRVHEQRVVGSRTNDAYLDAVFGVPAGESIEAVKPVADIEIVDGPLTVDGEGVGVDRDIDRAPPNIRFGVGML